MAPRKRIALVLVTIVSYVGCDQQTKALARRDLRGSEAKSFLGDTVRMDYAENPGGFLGLGALLPVQWRTAVFTIGCSAGIAVILLICAGGIGNLIDRWLYGYARDFLNIGMGPIRTGIFNIADAAVMDGCFLILLMPDRVMPTGRSARL
jgi:signal peptidase II